MRSDGDYLRIQSPLTLHASQTQPINSLRSNQTQPASRSSGQATATPPKHTISALTTMPITVYPTAHTAQPLDSLIANAHCAKDSTTLLRKTCGGDAIDIKRILQSSFVPSPNGTCTHLPHAPIDSLQTGRPLKADTQTPSSTSAPADGSASDLASATTIIPSINGFLESCIEAYILHRHLVLRPDDIWRQILIQLSIYINTHSSALRSKLVKHKDADSKQKLVVEYPSLSPEDVNWDDFCEKVVAQMGEYLEDESLRAWMGQELSTTTPTDRVIHTVAIMGSFKSYFSYACRTGDGLPTVTLQGTKVDWEQLVGAVERLAEFGEEPARWVRLLRAVLGRFVRCFEVPEAEETRAFWERIVFFHGRSGGNSYSGWITAFNFWNSKGRCLAAGELVADLRPDADEVEAAEYAGRLQRLEDYLESTASSRDCLIYDKAVFHRIQADDVANGYITAPLDICNMRGQKLFDGLLIAGHMGLQYSERQQSVMPLAEQSDCARLADDAKASGADGEQTACLHVDQKSLNTISVAAGWFMTEVGHVERSPQSTRWMMTTNAGAEGWRKRGDGGADSPWRPSIIQRHAWEQLYTVPR